MKYIIAKSELKVWRYPNFVYVKWFQR